jgi:hypothetical protein
VVKVIRKPGEPKSEEADNHAGRRCSAESVTERRADSALQQQPRDKDKDEEAIDGEVPKKRPRPARMFYYEAYNFFNQTEVVCKEDDFDGRVAGTVSQQLPDDSYMTDDEGDRHVEEEDSDDIYEIQCTDNVHKMCLSQCNFCGKIMALDRIFVHLNQAHAAFQFSREVKYHLVRKTYYR